ncbi:MAG: ABC transporter ATP-binding protein [Candidatus Latescibacteria bacterium]|nr:ABC transporter ATP-binding protein [Candidatus Latescibacterota bacterium]
MVGVTLEHITKTFGDVTAVEDVSLSIEKGELFFLLGPSGCGKTTLLRVIAGFYQPDRGRLLFDNRDVTDLPPHKRNTGMVFQNYALWPHMSVWKNVEYGLSIRKIPDVEKHRRVGKALEIVQMEIYADRSPNQLSGGQQQRVALARALVIEPDVVLMDEPLSNLDAKLRMEMRAQIKRIHSEVGVTMIYVTHDQKEALSMADRLSVLRDGRVVQVGDPREIYNHPRSRFVADFIGETNFLQGTILKKDEEIVVETPVGQIVTENKDRLLKGTHVTCSIRPEAISIVTEEVSGSESSSGRTTEQNRVTGTVESAMYLGETEQYLIRAVDGTAIRVIEHHPGRRKANIGERVTLTFQPGDPIILTE